MKLTNEKMYESASVMSGLEETGLLGYAIAKNRRKLLEELKEYDAKRSEIVSKYGISRGDGTFAIGDMAKFREELEPYATLESDVDVMTVPVEVFTSGGLTSQQMFALDWMVKE